MKISRGRNTYPPAHCILHPNFKKFSSVASISFLVDEVQESNGGCEWLNISNGIISFIYNIYSKIGLYVRSNLVEIITPLPANFLKRKGSVKILATLCKRKNNIELCKPSIFSQSTDKWLCCGYVPLYCFFIRDLVPASLGFLLLLFHDLFGILTSKYIRCG